MKLAIGHYHLNRGGVTRVIENQLLALDRALGDGERHEALVLYGGRCEGWPPDLDERLGRIRLRLQAVPELEYGSERQDAAGRLEERLPLILDRAGFDPGDTIVHLHNHAIGKNATLPRAVWNLAERGYGLLLQIHDFAEDQRHSNFALLAEAGDGQPNWHGRLYPQAPNVHFAVLNGRDHGVLQEAGVPAERLHFLPNPVLPLDGLPEYEPARRELQQRFGVPPQARFLLYPVRGIRRKNLGEALLHSLLAPEGTIVALTLPPLNPAERPRYDAWKSAAEQWKLPFRFEVGAPGGLTFAENMAASDAILTTSVAEGFGMVYLEAWLADRMLVGRDLPEITGDFKAAGLDLAHLRSRLEIPADWVDRQELRDKMTEAFRQAVTAYGRSLPEDLPAQLDARLGDDTIDFGDLDESLQANVLEKAVGARSACEELATANPRIAQPLSGSGTETITTNKEVVQRDFALEPSGNRLSAVLHTVLESPRGDAVEPLADAKSILDRFLNLDRFRLLRS